MDVKVLIITAIISCCVSFFMGGILAYLVAKLKSVHKREKALQEGMQSLLRDKLIESHDKYTERKYCPIYAKESARRSYEAYRDLGGNGIITKLYDDIVRLPEEPPEKD